MGRLSKQGKKIYKLSRDSYQREYFFKTLTTQLVEHERIKSTYIKCKALKPYADRVMKYAIRYVKFQDSWAKKRVDELLYTDFARNKIIKEIAPRLIDRQNHFSRVVNLNKNRKGDCAPIGYIEYVWNDLEKYETALEKEKIEKGQEPDKKAFENKILVQERDLFLKKIQESEENNKLSSLDNQELLHRGEITNSEYQNRDRINKIQLEFFKEKLRRVEHDLFIINKNKFDLQHFPKHFN